MYLIDFLILKKAFGVVLRPVIMLLIIEFTAS